MTEIDLTKDAIIMDMRRSIDHFDIAFLHLLAERMRVVEKILYLKQQRRMKLTQGKARRDDIEELIEMSVQLKLEKRFIKKFLDLVFQHALKHFSQKEKQREIVLKKQICQGLSLDDLRKNLLNLDKSLCLLLAERIRIVKRIGVYKNQLKIPALDSNRWQQLLANKIKMAERLEVSSSLVEQIFNSIHELSLNIENKIAGPQV